MTSEERIANSHEVVFYQNVADRVARAIRARMIERDTVIFDQAMAGNVKIMKTFYGKHQILQSNAIQVGN